MKEKNQIKFNIYRQMKINNFEGLYGVGGQLSGINNLIMYRMLISQLKKSCQSQSGAYRIIG